MARYLETLAFALPIGGKFLAAIVLISKRDSIYGDIRQPELDRDRSQPGENSRHGLVGHPAKVAQLDARVNPEVRIVKSDLAVFSGAS
jgi:hypothetical protein